MIVQGTNIAMTFEFPESVSSVMDMEVLLYTASGEQLKRWSIEPELSSSGQLLSVSEDGMKVYAPLTQEETSNFPAGECFIEIKWLTEIGETVFASPISETIVARKDHKNYLDEVGQGWLGVTDSAINASGDITTY